MPHFDVFNGDADGIFALVQLRQHQPLLSHKITGTKRDIGLLARCAAQPGDSVTVLDISMANNQPALQRLLAQRVQVFYADHHLVEEQVQHPQLTAHIDYDPNCCTSLIINKLLQQRYPLWAIAGAFGDNLIERANLLCQRLGLTQAKRDFLYELGTLVNYNSYGEQLDDLHFDPAALFTIINQYDSPFALSSDTQSPYLYLKNAYQQDWQKVQQIAPIYADAQLEVYCLPDQGFSRRLSGVFSNALANANPDKAHLVLTYTPSANYKVSLRAPLNNRQGAGELCSRFTTGGGREGAGGINQLPSDLLESLIKQVSDFYVNNETT